MIASQIFVIVALPGVVLIVDAETSGGVVLVRKPSRGELDALEQAAARDDVATVMERAFDLAGLGLRQVALLSPEARTILENTIAARISGARTALVS